VSATRRHRGAHDVVPYLAVTALTVLILGVAGTWAAMAAGAALAGRAAPPGNPFAAVIYLMAGRTPWPGPAATAIAAAELAVAGALGAAGWRIAARHWPRAGVDAAAGHLASRRELAGRSRDDAGQTAVRLGVAAPQPGVRIGRARRNGQPVYGTWEETHCDIWGTRRGKTTSRVVPAIIDAPGAAVVTSNKRDVVDATRGIREEAGQVWAFDPQCLAGEQPTWWWNPLSYISGVGKPERVDKATQLAAVLANYSRPAGARQDAYFEPKGEQLLACLLLAAAEAGEPVTMAFEWAADPTENRPADILRETGHRLPAAALQGVLNAPDRQRAGVYGTAEKIISFLVSPAITRWVTDDPARPGRPEFVPRDFVAGTGTLYLLSREGQGTAGPLTTALTMATIEAAEERAARSPDGRLAVPLLAVLDEAANVCRWKDLPDLYSHYGSRGIVLMTLLQSWAQGVEVWGEHGMTKMWSAANIRVYGGGEANTRFLGDLSQLVGDFELTTTSVSVQHGGTSGSRSVTTSSRPEKILDVADLAAMPLGRAIVFGGGRPFLIETEPWQNGPHADRVRASIAARVPPGDAEELRRHELQLAAGPEEW
jgi:type IV secretory pathway TraG/TraD family ATPase VirD4